MRVGRQSAKPQDAPAFSMNTALKAGTLSPRSQGKKVTHGFRNLRFLNWNQLTREEAPKIAKNSQGDKTFDPHLYTQWQADRVVAWTPVLRLWGSLSKSLNIWRAVFSSERKPWQQDVTYWKAAMNRHHTRTLRHMIDLMFSSWQSCEGLFPFQSPCF